MTVNQVVAEISKDEVFYFHSGGGVTISGGECLNQPDFVASVLWECRFRGIHTAIDTNLSVEWEIIEKVLPYVDEIYVDIKHPVGNKHREFVGVTNDLILSNLEKLGQSVIPFSLHIRIPLIPGINDDDDSLLALIPIVEPIKKIKEIEILPYHRLGAGTYAQLGRIYQLEGLKPPSKEHISERIEYLKQHGLTIPVKSGGFISQE